MPIAKRRQAERSVGARVFDVADANERLFEKLHDNRDHFLPAQGHAAQILRDTAADAWQRARKRHHARILCLMAHFFPSRVIAVLLAAARVAARRLQVRFRVGDIQTSVHAGGMASDWMRPSVAASGTGRPVAPT